MIIYSYMPLKLWQELTICNYFGTLTICHNSKSTIQFRWVIYDMWPQNMLIRRCDLLRPIFCDTSAVTKMVYVGPVGPMAKEFKKCIMMYSIYMPRSKYFGTITISLSVVLKRIFCGTFFVLKLSTRPLLEVPHVPVYLSIHLFVCFTQHIYCSRMSHSILRKKSAQHFLFFLVLITLICFDCVWNVCWMWIRRWRPTVISRHISQTFSNYILLSNIINWTVTRLSAKTLSTRNNRIRLLTKQPTAMK